ncbi:carbamoyltransferase HypF [Puniceicoccales bacterium CK1056]|uniref:Carbamoyltransferase n=1 Tax=Oceanipulchritudo coccoides TaxID=2706888 RepID=A0A6B2M4R9_9BACT|nr:carbamoyltransferase HypF [Oceanipulchritudo coccoides]NDV63084.1 carbamoyltransferase HypF [Oceanipulchritudo coccoides]
MDTKLPGKEFHEVLIYIRGTVQGVGFRPFIARLADRYSISGWVRNDGRGVTIGARQTKENIRLFTDALLTELPGPARIDDWRVENPDTGSIDPTNAEFKILESPLSGESPIVPVTPDLAICPDCRSELMDPDNRRYHYPFINCTNCGPRYSIVESLPYDRERTTMSAFTMCPSCMEEYSNPLDRRFHAQPNACPDCGPQLSLVGMDGGLLAGQEGAVDQACDALRLKAIVAVKGLGGFHLFADASCAETIQLLRRRKHRDQKPFAVMFPDIESLRSHCHVTTAEEALLNSPAAPIVLVRQRTDSKVAVEVAPGNPWIGAILPYTPLHILLMSKFAGPLVATSANLSEEPLCSDNAEAIKRLAGIADMVLQHDRPIARAVDDSVLRISSHGSIVLRRSRGYAPTPLRLPENIGCTGAQLSVGAHLKNTIAIAMEKQVVVSPHIGDLSNNKSVKAFERTIDLLSRLYGGTADKVVCDLHPDYMSTQFAESLGIPIVRVQHHLAHIFSCLLEHGGGPEKVLGVVWDGTGYGEDKTIWGGEFIIVDKGNGTARRVAHLKPFPLPGGEAAVRQTGRSAVGLLYAANFLGDHPMRELVSRALGEEASNLPLLVKALEKNLNAPVTTSAGRLFDAAAALLGLSDRNTFEGQAGMAMEFAAAKSTSSPSPLPWRVDDSHHQAGALEVDWAPMILNLCTQFVSGNDPNQLAMDFHKTLASMILDVAQRIGVESVVLSGGCFQNAILSDFTTDLLKDSNFKVLLHHQLSPNDNSISAGQALAALTDITRVKS